MKKVSIIVPVYNVEKYIKKCIDSILSQTYENIEIIIVNDGSEQGEDKIIREYTKGKYANLFKYIKKETNEGLFKARITGVKHATGDFIEFVDADDYIEADFVRAAMEKMCEDVDIVYSSTTICNFEGKKEMYPIMDTFKYIFPIYGDEIKKLYFSQEGIAYYWHTMWNKIYRKSLWDKCLGFFELIDNSLVMLEDILFSSVLLYNAKGLSVAPNAVYYYCQHNDSSTGLGEIEYKQFHKNITNIKYVFDSLDSYFENKELYICTHVKNMRKIYARMWSKSIDRVDREHADACKLDLDRLCEDRGETTTYGDGYFYALTTEYNNELNVLCEKIINGNEQIISFDIFETSVKRPFYNPKDIFFILDKEFEKEFVCGTSFHTIRIEGEEGCRARCSQKEDITLSEIYSYISETYYIPFDLCMKIKAKEIDLEVHFNKKREVAFYLYQLALFLGKQIIFTSDMYLEYETIKTILETNGYTKYDRIFVSSEYAKTKRTGNLYKTVITEMQCEPSSILHIGDNSFSDLEMAKKCGLNAWRLPSCMDAFDEICKADSKRAKISGYGCMVQLIANMYFDNPYKSAHPLSNYCADPYFMGLYPLGMNVVSQIIKLDECVQKYNAKRIIFTSRDGYLLKKAFDDYNNIAEKNIVTEYRYVSRKSMLPLMLETKTDFLNLPIVYFQYTPEMIVDLLDFCTEDKKSCCEKMSADIKTRKFESIKEYHSFIKFFLDSFYSKSKHEATKRKAISYWSDVCDTDIIYDMGYSASIHNAIAKASGSRPLAFFVHSDIDKHMHLMRSGEFSIECCMDSIPQISGLIREFFFSELAPSCIAYDGIDNEIVPVFEAYEKRFSDTYPLMLMQKAALNFCHEFWTTFNEYIDYIDIRKEDVSAVFEIFLENVTPIDLRVFSASYFEDKIYGANENLNVRLFWRNELSKANKTGVSSEDIEKDVKDIMNSLGKSKLAFWGTGKICRELINDNPWLKVDYFFDNSVDKIGTKINDTVITKPDNLADYSDTLIIIACAMYLEIAAQLDNCGLKQYKDYITYIDVFG